jgi:alginate O-acetyltransferase complex protein AlgI
MKFQTILYLCFLTFVWLVCVTLKRPSLRRVLILLASYVFYFTWGPPFLLVLVGSSFFNYLWGRLLRDRPRLSTLWIGLAANILLLGFYKYAAWLVGGFGISNSFLASVIAPIGLSFYTFQAMSHLFDVYRGAEQELHPTLIEFCLYMAFWPTVLAGPVCRVGEMIPQFRRMNRPAVDDVSAGVQRILFGLFMKVVLADTLAFGLLAGEGVNSGFNSLSRGWSGIDVWFLAIGFGFQLYFDFAGYSHVAIGSARVFGISVRENFQDPYVSLTPSEFWTRWHMSLSAWIRDYLFMPLAMARREFWWRVLATVFSMIIFGMWHGAGATFLLWGLYHGVLLAGHRIIQHLWRTKRAEASTGRLGLFLLSRRVMSWGITFLLISLGWVLFRANNLRQAGMMFRAVLTPNSYFRLTLRPNFYIVVAMIAVGYFVYLGIRELVRSLEQNGIVRRLTWALSPVSYCLIIIAVIIWSKQAATFVYLQF